MTDTKKLREGIPYDAGIGLAGRIEAAEALMRSAADEIDALRRTRNAARILCETLREVHASPIYPGPCYAGKLKALEGLL